MNDYPIPSMSTEELTRFTDVVVTGAKEGQGAFQDLIDAALAEDDLAFGRNFSRLVEWYGWEALGLPKRVVN